MRYTRRCFLGGLLVFPAAVLPAGRGDADRSFSFAQVCDPQLGFGGYLHDVALFRQAVQEINEARPDFVVICGDLVNETGNDQAIKDFNAIKSGFDMPCHCVPGNHDVGNTPTAASVARYRGKMGRDWYAFEHKGLTFVAVDTQLWKSPVEGESEKQDAWLVKTLAEAGSRKSPVVIFGHYPLFAETADEEEGYYGLPVDKRAELIQRYKAHGVVAVLSGHMHKNAVHNLDGIQLVTSATTCRNFDGAPFGYRLWHVDGQGGVTHEYIPLSTARMGTWVTLQGRLTGLEEGERGRVFAFAGRHMPETWTLEQVKMLDRRCLAKEDASKGMFTLRNLPAGEITLVAAAYRPGDGGAADARFRSRVLEVTAEGEEKVTFSFGG